MPTDVAIVLNCSARSDQANAQRTRLAEILKAAGLEADLLTAERGSEIPALARDAARRAYRLVVAGGGDGTVNAVASAIAGSGKLLGVLPLGTLNHFAKHIGVPGDLEGAVQVLLGGEPLQVDAGEVNGQLFLNNSSLGLYPTIVRHRELQQQREGHGKWRALLSAAFTVLRRPFKLRLRLELDGQSTELRTPFVFIGNNEYSLQPLDLGTRPSLDGGKLGVCVARPAGRFWMLRLALNLLVGRLARAPELDVTATSALRIHSNRKRLDVALDGEVRTLETPLNYRSLPGLLSVLAPRATPEPAAKAAAETAPAPA